MADKKIDIYAHNDYQSLLNYINYLNAQGIYNAQIIKYIK